MQREYTIEALTQLKGILERQLNAKDIINNYTEELEQLNNVRHQLIFMNAAIAKLAKDYAITAEQGISGLVNLHNRLSNDFNLANEQGKPQIAAKCRQIREYLEYLKVSGEF